MEHLRNCNCQKFDKIDEGKNFTIQNHNTPSPTDLPDAHLMYYTENMDTFFEEKRSIYDKGIDENI